MKTTILSLLLLAFSVTPVFAQANMCNQKCDVDSDCGSGYRCYVGVCRLNSCPAASTCVCTSGSATATPVSTPKASTTPTASPTAKPTASPTPIATTSATLKHTPKTGFESWLLAGGAFLLFGLGSALQGSEKLFATRKLSPRDLVKHRQSSST